MTTNDTTNSEKQLSNQKKSRSGLNISQRACRPSSSVNVVDATHPDQGNDLLEDDVTTGTLTIKSLDLRVSVLHQVRVVICIESKFYGSAHVYEVDNISHEPSVHVVPKEKATEGNYQATCSITHTC